MSYNELKEHAESSAKEKNKSNKKQKIISAISGVLAATSILGASVGLASCGKNEDPKLPEDKPGQTQIQTQRPDAGYIAPQDGMYQDTFGGEDYIFCTTDYVYQLAGQALDFCEQTFASDPEIKDMGKNGFYQSFFNEDMLAAISFTESSFRVKKANGQPLESSTGALGMCQVEPITIDTINSWLPDTMGVRNLSYTKEDAKDPLKALQMATFALIRSSKNETKPSDETYKQLGVPYSEELEEKLLYAMYFYGEDNFEKACANGTMFSTYLNPEWRDANGNNYVYTVLKNKEMLMAERQQNSRQSDGFCK